jgi:hypothetical protein
MKHVSTTYVQMQPDLSAPGIDIIASWSRLSSPTEYPNDTRKVQYNIISAHPWRAHTWAGPPPTSSHSTMTGHPRWSCQLSSPLVRYNKLSSMIDPLSCIELVGNARPCTRSERILLILVWTRWTWYEYGYAYMYHAFGGIYVHYIKPGYTHVIISN